MDELQLRELVAEALTDSVQDRRALLKLSGAHARLDEEYKQLVEAWFGIYENLSGKTYDGHPMNVNGAIREKIAELQTTERKRCSVCGAELISSKTGCADEPDDCLVCSLRDDIDGLLGKGSANHSRVQILVKALQAAGIEPGLKCAEFKTDDGSILIGINADGKTFDVEWTPDGVTPRFRG